jgi:hypothetical protein
MCALTRRARKREPWVPTLAVMAVNPASARRQKSAQIDQGHRVECVKQAEPWSGHREVHEHPAGLSHVG